MKKNSIGLFLFSISFFMIFSVPKNVEASTEGTTWHRCSTPTSNTAYDKKPSFGTSTAYGTKHYHTTKTNHSGDVYVPGVVIDGKYYPGYTDHSADFEETVENDTDVTETCSATYTESGSKASGTVTYNVTYSNGSVSTSQTHYAYYVIDVKVTVSKDKTYVDESAPTFSCTKTYGDGTKAPCTDSLSNVTDTTSGDIRKVCYEYKDNGQSDKACTERVYVSKVEITAGPEHVYTGGHHTFECKATFGDSKTKTISSSSDVWSSTPQNFIGDQYKGYKDPRGTIISKQRMNDFYPSDRDGKNYTIQCRYYDGASNSNKWISDPTNVKKHTKTVRLHGIKEMKIEVTGSFMDVNNPTGPKYIKKTNVLPDQSTKYWKEFDFIKGHWYDFNVYVMYDDNSDGDGNPGSPGWKKVTSAPEVYWTSQPGYDAARKTYYSQMSKDGTDHRIPANGNNSIVAEYFHPGSNYGADSPTSATLKGSTSGVDGRTKQLAKAWAHEIIDLKIRGAGSYSAEPVKTVQGGATQQYSAWVVWSDEGTNPFGRGKKENWTTYDQLWKGDDIIAPGSFKAPRGNGEKRTIYIVYGDNDRLYDGKKVWDNAFDKIEITITDNCSGVDYIRLGCPASSSSAWQVKDGAKEKENYIPPIYGGANPYDFLIKFPVTGISNGNGFQ